MLQQAATHCNTGANLKRSTYLLSLTHHNTLQHAATRCDMLQHAATYCNTGANLKRSTYLLSSRHIKLATSPVSLSISVCLSLSLSLSLSLALSISLSLALSLSLSLARSLSLALSLSLSLSLALSLSLLSPRHTHLANSHVSPSLPLPLPLRLPLSLPLSLSTSHTHPLSSSLSSFFFRLLARFSSRSLAVCCSLAKDLCIYVGLFSHARDKRTLFLSRLLLSRERPMYLCRSLFRRERQKSPISLSQETNVPTYVSLVTREAKEPYFSRKRDLFTYVGLF